MVDFTITIKNKNMRQDKFYHYLKKSAKATAHGLLITTECNNEINSISGIHRDLKNNKQQI